MMTADRSQSLTRRIKPGKPIGVDFCKTDRSVFLHYSMLSASETIIIRLLRFINALPCHFPARSLCCTWVTSPSLNQEVVIPCKAHLSNNPIRLLHKNLKWTTRTCFLSRHGNILTSEETWRGRFYYCSCGLWLQTQTFIWFNQISTHTRTVLKSSSGSERHL